MWALGWVNQSILKVKYYESPWHFRHWRDDLLLALITNLEIPRHTKEADLYGYEVEFDKNLNFSSSIHTLVCTTLTTDQKMSLFFSCLFSKLSKFDAF